MAERKVNLFKAVRAGIIAGAVVGGMTESAGSGVIAGAEWIAGTMLIYEATRDMANSYVALIGRRKISYLLNSLKSIAESTAGFGLLGATVGLAFNDPKPILLTAGVGAGIGLMTSIYPLITNRFRTQGVNRNSQIT